MNVELTYKSIRAGFNWASVYETQRDNKFEKKLQKKWARFGIDLPEDENILFALVGLDILATDQNLYLGGIDPIPLEEIYTVTSPKGDLLSFMGGGDKD